MSGAPQDGQKLLGPLRSAEQSGHRIMAQYCKVTTRGRVRLITLVMRKARSIRSGKISVIIVNDDQGNFTVVKPHRSRHCNGDFNVQ
jgi:hypothetical protein